MTKETTGAIRNALGRGPRSDAIRAVTAAFIVTCFLGGAIVTDGVSISVADNVALAKGGNGGGKGGRGGGHGGGNRGSRGDVSDRGLGFGHAKGTGRGHAKGHGQAHAGRDGENNGHSHPPGAPSLGKKTASENGISAAALGSLNAAHASSTARENASPNSMVGQIAAFADAVESDNINAAAEALAAKANKSITESVVTEVARQAQIELSEETAGAIATRAAEIQADENREPIGESMPGGS